MSARKPKARRYPPLPKRVMGAGGVIDVAVVDEIKGGTEDEDVLGMFKPMIRRIEILKALRGDQRWLVFYHELAHAALWDTGAHNALGGQVEEVVCDAFATARLREKFG